jgi:hypothetical protein
MGLLRSDLAADGFPLVMAARTTRAALLMGLLYGGLQDAVGFARGRHIGYIDAIQSTFRRSAEESATQS